jgi:nicotinate dehydrogenase subunit B
MSEPAKVATYLRLDPDRTLVVTPGKVELGQGIATAFADEVSGVLGVPLDRVRVMPVDTKMSPNEWYTAGSLSVSTSVQLVRRAAATLHDHLCELVAGRLDRSRAFVTIADGVFAVDGVAIPLSIWDIANDIDPALVVGADEHTTIVPSVGAQRLDLPAKIAGEGVFLHDLDLPGMLHARVVRPRGRGARLVQLEADVIAGTDGIVKIVQDGNFLGVITEREQDAVRIAADLAASARWDGGDSLPDNDEVTGLLRSLPTSDITHERRGEAPPPPPPPTHTFSATFERPFLAHASIGTSVAVARWDGALAEAEVWTHSQGVYPLRRDLALAFGVAEQSIRVRHVQGAGCYGHNGADDVAYDAALLARAVPGRPVRVAWSREDELTWSPMGPAAVLDLAAQVADDGTIVRWISGVWGQGHNNRPGSFATPALLGAAEQAGGVPLVSSIDAPLEAGGGNLRNAVPYYDVPTWRVTAHVVTTTIVRTSSLRSLGAFLNVFAIESTMDDLARVYGIDPVAYRLMHLSDRRAIDVIDTVVDRSGWHTRPPAEGTGLGLGFARYKNSSGYCAVVAEVKAEAELEVVELWAAVDVGRVVNSDGLVNQVEGGAIQATSWTTRESVRFEGSGVRSDSWTTYPILRFGEIPQMSVAVINRPAEPPLGAGEISSGPTAAAIGNALYAATGIRVRRLPMTTRHIVDAMDSR